jgi:hypothetical protein
MVVGSDTFVFASLVPSALPVDVSWSHPYLIEGRNMPANA